MQPPVHRQHPQEDLLRLGVLGKRCVSGPVEVSLSSGHRVVWFFPPGLRSPHEKISVSLALVLVIACLSYQVALSQEGGICV